MLNCCLLTESCFIIFLTPFESSQSIIFSATWKAQTKHFPSELKRHNITSMSNSLSQFIMCSWFRSDFAKAVLLAFHGQSTCGC